MNRDTHARDRRDALVTAAFSLFAKKGYGETTMDEVAARAKVSRRTAFRYFPTKEELVFPARHERLDAFRALLEGDEDAFLRVKRACLALAADYARDRERLLAQWRIVEKEPDLLAAEQRFDLKNEDAIASTFADGHPSPLARRRARVRAGAVVGAIRATLRDWLEGGAKDDLVRLGEETFAELESGFRSEEKRR